jgi:hypothetical protein
VDAAVHIDGPGVQNCYVGEFAAFRSAGTMGRGTSGGLTLSPGLQGYTGQFFCEMDDEIDGLFSRGNENFNLGYYPPPTPEAPETIKGTLTLRIPNSGVIPCRVQIQGSR